MTLAHFGIDVAIWAAACKTVAQPLHRLLGSYRDRWAVYYTKFPGEQSADELIAEACRLAELGFSSIKPALIVDPADPGPGLDR